MGIFPKFSVEAGLNHQSIKLACFQQSVLSDCVEFYITALVTRLLFYLAGSGASSPLTSPSSPTPPSTAGASSTPPAPPPPPLPPAAPPPSTEVPMQPNPQPAVSASRGALLSSIQNFQKGTLKKTQTCDYSAPRIS